MLGPGLGSLVGVSWPAACWVAGAVEEPVVLADLNGCGNRFDGDSGLDWFGG